VEGKTMKNINYQGREIVVSAIQFRFMEEKNPQNGILIHDTADANRDGDAIYGNGWTIDQINDESDLDTLFADTCGTTYWHLGEDGIYVLDA
jgi:hypothetical protein